MLASNINVAPLCHAAQRQRDLWNVNPLRTAHPGSPHGEAEDIWLRFSPLEDPAAVMDGLDSVNYPGFAALPQARPIVFDLMRLVEGERLGRVLITRLKPGGRITRHADEGEYAAHFDRYHVSLHGLPGSIFRAGDETVSMATGECWWFDNQAPHEVVNNSADDRIHLIVDIRPC